MESCLARRLVSRRIEFVNEKRRIGPRRGGKEKEETVDARVGDIYRWNRFVTILIEAVDGNVPYFFTDLLFAGSGFSPFKAEFNSSSLSA